MDDIRCRADNAVLARRMFIVALLLAVAFTTNAVAESPGTSSYIPGESLDTLETAPYFMYDCGLNSFIPSQTIPEQKAMKESCFDKLLASIRKLKNNPEPTLPLHQTCLKDLAWVGYRFADPRYKKNPNLTLKPGRNDCSGLLNKY